MIEVFFFFFVKGFAKMIELKSPYHNAIEKNQISSFVKYNTTFIHNVLNILVKSCESLFYLCETWGNLNLSL